MGVFRQLAEYLYLKKKDPSRPSNREIRAMHWSNRISILVFLLCLILLAIKLLRK
jgi:hypothetical protein